MQIEKDKEHHLTIAMRQMVRQLTLELNITGKAKERITGLSASLSGIAGAVNIENGNPEGSAVTTVLAFEQQPDGKYKTLIRLLGITGSEQALSLILHFENGVPADITVTSDLAAKLAAFNADRKTPLTLKADIATTVTPMGVSAEISDWEGGGNETVVAE